MATINTDTSTLAVISRSIEMYVGFLETGDPRLRRNDAIDRKQFDRIKKTTFEVDKKIVTLCELMERMARVSPGRAFDLPDQLLGDIRKALQVRVAFIETGTPYRLEEVERLLRSGTDVRRRPLIPLMTHQEQLVAMLLKIDSQMDDLCNERLAAMRSPSRQINSAATQSAWDEPAPARIMAKM